jgi:competence protein ComFC
MANLLSSGLNILADVFYPKYCFGCRRSGKYLCKFCTSQIPTIAQSFCIMCNKPSPDGRTHNQCRSEFSPDRLLSAFPYQNDVVSEMVIAGKYMFVSETFAVLGLLAAETIKSRWNKNTFTDYIICPIPLHPSRKRWRGFNQADIIGSAFEHSLQIPSIGLLARTKNTRTQKDLDLKSRLANLHDAFSVTQEIPQKVILIDDVCTTGRTFIEAGKVLKQAGAKEVICISIAKD